MSSRGLVKITEAREVRTGRDDGQGERQGMVGQVEYKGMKPCVVHDQLLDNDQPDKLVIRRETEIVRLMALACSQLQKKLETERVTSKENRILAIPEIVKNRGDEAGDAGSEVIRHPMILQAALRPPLQYCINSNGIDQALISVRKKGHWKRQARMKGAEI